MGVAPEAEVDKDAVAFQARAHEDYGAAGTANPRNGTANCATAAHFVEAQKTTEPQTNGINGNTASQLAYTNAL